MEKTVITWRFCNGWGRDIARPGICFPSFKGATVRLTDQRILVKVLFFPVWEAALSEVVSVVVNPAFLWMKSVEVTLNNGNGIIFWVWRPGIGKLTDLLRGLRLPVQSDSVS